MPEQYVHFAYPVLILILALFFIYRLKITETKKASGAGFIYAGLVLTFLVAVMNLVKQHPDYSDWFLGSVYPYIVIGEFAVFAAGLIMFVIGMALYFSHWGDRVIELDSQMDKLKLLENIQQECRPPYPMPELLNRALNGMLIGLDEKAGAVYLFDQDNRTYTLAAASGLADDEVSLLRDYEYGRNVVSEALDNETPLTTSDFRSLGGRAQLALTKFNSLLILPLISGKSRLGAILFFSAKKSHYSDEFVSLVAPIVDWLSIKVELTQLGRTIRRSKIIKKDVEQQIDDLHRKLKNLVSVAAGGSTPDQFSEKCRILVDADEAWIIGISNGKLIFYTDSPAKADFSDNYKAALISGIKKGKPVVLNQEDVDRSGNNVIVRSSLLYPINDAGDALLLRKRGGAISIDNRDLKIFDLAATLAGVVISTHSIREAAKERRRGLETVNKIIGAGLGSGMPEQTMKDLIGKLPGIISDDAVVLIFKRVDNNLEAVHSNIDDEAVKDITVSIGEGGVGRVVALKGPEAEFGADGVNKYLEQYNEENRIAIRKLFGDLQDPVFHADYPILISNRAAFVLSVYDFIAYAGGDQEKHQLLSILTGLFNLRLELASIGKSKARIAPITEEKPPSVLAVADQPVILDLMTSMCQSMGCRVRATNNGLEALSVFESTRPDIVIIDLATRSGPQDVEISDLAQKGLSAWDIASRIKAVSPVTAIIAVAGWGITVDERKLEESGFNFILKKPFRFEHFHEIIMKAVKISNNA